MYRHMWRADAAGNLLQPLLYLLGMGIGVGALVDESGQSTEMLGGVSYLAFLAPALIATTAMMTSATEALWPLLAGFKWTNQFLAMTATPLHPVDVVSGFALWVATRAVIGSAAVAAVLVLFDETRSWGLLAAIVFGVLTGLAFAMPVAAWTSTQEREISFPAIIRFGLIPLFLFAGAFFPIDQLPEWAQPIAYVTPLYHGVELTRGAVLGTLDLGAAAGHVAVLVAYAGVRLRDLPAHVHDEAWSRVTDRERRSTITSGLRIVPAAALELRRPQRMIERSAMVNRRTWLIMFSGFFEPLFYLMSIRIGVGELIGDVTVDGVTVDYAEFVAPALLAASAMNGAIYETTMNVFFKLRYERLYDTVLATPMTPADVALGEIGWAVIRGGLYSVAFLVTMTAMGMAGVAVGHLGAAVQPAHRLRLRLRRNGDHHVHAVVGRLRVRHGGNAAVVPVLGDVLSRVELRAVGLGRAAQPAVPRRRPRAFGEHGRVRLGDARPHRRAARDDGRRPARRRPTDPHAAVEVTSGVPDARDVTTTPTAARSQRKASATDRLWASRMSLR